MFHGSFIYFHSLKIQKRQYQSKEINTKCKVHVSQHRSEEPDAKQV